jgi:SRSO17 transposase
MSITRAQYIEYLIATPKNYTATNLADHLGTVSHDAITDFLAIEKVNSKDLWEQVKPIIRDTFDSYLIIDDSVQDKSYSNKIEVTQYQWSGLEGKVIKGIGVVSLVHVENEAGEHNVIDYRIYNKNADGKTKNQHFRDMVLKAKERGIKARKICFDAWYSSADNLKWVHRLGMVFVAAMKSNRQVSVSKEAGYVKITNLVWNEESLEKGMWVKLKEVPFKVRLFKVVAKNGDIDWIITNDSDSSFTVNVIQAMNAVRWRIEQVNRDVKQLLGSEKCQCRKQRSQRNHIALVFQAWVSLVVYAREFGISVYQAKDRLWGDYLRNELQCPTVRAFGYT